MESQVSINSLPLDLLGEITRFLGACDVVSVKCSSRTLKSKMERGGLASFIVNKWDRIPRSSKWLHPVLHSRLQELEVVTKQNPLLDDFIIQRLPSSLRRLKLNFPSAMAFLEPLVTTPGVTKSIYESFKMVDLDAYYPELTSLELVDTELKWVVNEAKETFVPTQADLKRFIEHLPPKLTHLELSPFPSKTGKMEGLPSHLQSLSLCCGPPLHKFCLPSGLTRLQVMMEMHQMFANANVPEYECLDHLKELTITGTFLEMNLKLPANLEILRLSNTPVELNTPASVTELHLGNASNMQRFYSWPCIANSSSTTSNQEPSSDQGPKSNLRTLYIETTVNLDFAKLPRSLTSLATGSTSERHFRLGYLNSELTHLPPALVSLTLVGHHRITHDVWFLLPKTLKILKLPDLTVNSAFLKLIPHSLAELSIGILNFSFNAGMALLEDCPTHLEIPKSLQIAFVSKLVPKHVIFTLKRSECDVNDTSASKLPPNLQSLTILGSQVGITDDFIRLLPRSLHCLRMPNQMTFTSRIASYLPPGIKTLIIDSHGFPDDLTLPASITCTNLRYSPKNSRWFDKSH